MIKLLKIGNATFELSDKTLSIQKGIACCVLNEEQLEGLRLLLFDTGFLVRGN